MNNWSNHKYMETLLEIAKVQKRLLFYSMDWKERVAIPLPQMERKGLFGLKKQMPSAWYEREALLRKLEDLKGQARQMVPIGNGNYWWDVPWEEVERELHFDLVEVEQRDGWRFECKWEKIQTENSQCLLFCEEGHCSSFDRHYDLEFYETSNYSIEEREHLMKEYNAKVNQKEWQASVALSGYRIHSLRSEQNYDSIHDYLMSAEHHLIKNYNKATFEDSLSTQHQKNAVRVASNSLHYQSIYYTAEYVVSNLGYLMAWNLGEYSLLESVGELPKAMVERRQQRDAAVASAAFLADQSEIKVIPCSLLGLSVAEPLESEVEALRYGELMTCMAEKLFYDD